MQSDRFASVSMSQEKTDCSGKRKIRCFGSGPATSAHLGTTQLSRPSLHVRWFGDFLNALPDVSTCSFLSRLTQRLRHRRHPPHPSHSSRKGFLTKCPHHSSSDGRTHLSPRHLSRPSYNFFLSSGTSYSSVRTSDSSSSFRVVSAQLSLASDPTRILHHRKSCGHRPLRKSFSTGVELQECDARMPTIRSYNFSLPVTMSVPSIRKVEHQSQGAVSSRPIRTEHARGISAILGSFTSSKIPTLYIHTISERTCFPSPN